MTGAQYEALNESYVIFITENDVLGMKKFTYEDIARATGLIVDEIKELATKQPA